MTGAGGPTAVPVGALDVVTGAAAGACAGANDSPLGTAGAGMTGGVANGAPTCRGGDTPCPITFMAPCVRDCAGPDTGCPAAIPVTNDWPTGPGEKPWPMAAGAIGPPGIVGNPGANGAPLPGIGIAVAGDGARTGGPPGTGPPAPANPPIPSAATGDPCIAAFGGVQGPLAVPLLVSPLAPSGAADGSPLEPRTPPGLVPVTPRPPDMSCDEVRSPSLIGGGAGASSTLKPWSCIHLRALVSIPSPRRISWVPETIVSIAVQLAFEAAALQANWTRCIDAGFASGGSFDAMMSSICLLPSFAMASNLLRRTSTAFALALKTLALVSYFSARSR